MKKILLILFLATGWLACTRPDLPPDLTVDPVFSVYFTEGDTAASITAGISEYYLFTHYATDNQGVVVCAGSFAKATCPSGDCPESLTFEFRNYSQNSAVFPDTLFYTGNHQFSKPGVSTTTIYRTTFTATNAAPYNQFLWKINNVSLPATDVNSIVVDFMDNGTQKVELQALGNQKSTVQRTINLLQGFPLDSMLSVDILVHPDTVGFGYYVDALVSGALPYNFKWSTGNTGDQIYLQDTIGSTYTVTVTNGQDTAVAALKDLISVPVTYRSANFTFQVEEINMTTGDSLNLGNVAIQWVDNQGVVWRSDRAAQANNAQFTVLESAGYDLNENGEKTRKMRVAFHCTLFNNDGAEKDFSGEGVIAVAYP